MAFGAKSKDPLVRQQADCAVGPAVKAQIPLAVTFDARRGDAHGPGHRTLGHAAV